MAKIWKQTKCPLTDEWMKKMWLSSYSGIFFNHKMEGNSAMSNKNEP
jgi:hypothetical protein